MLHSFGAFPLPLKSSLPEAPINHRPHRPSVEETHDKATATMDEESEGVPPPAMGGRAQHATEQRRGEKKKNRIRRAMRKFGGDVRQGMLFLCSLGRKTDSGV